MHFCANIVWQLQFTTAYEIYEQATDSTMQISPLRLDGLLRSYNLRAIAPRCSSPPRSENRTSVRGRNISSLFATSAETLEWPYSLLATTPRRRTFLNRLKFPRADPICHRPNKKKPACAKMHNKWPVLVVSQERRRVQAPDTKQTTKTPNY